MHLPHVFLTNKLKLKTQTETIDANQNNVSVL